MNVCLTVPGFLFFLQPLGKSGAESPILVAMLGLMGPGVAGPCGDATALLSPQCFGQWPQLLMGTD